MPSIGLDGHKTFAEVAILEPGADLARQRISTDPAARRAFAATLTSDDQVGLEATMSTWAIAELLAGHAGRLVVSNPRRTTAIAGAKIKTDTVDALTLAQLLAADCIPPVWIPAAPTRRLRRQIAHRAALVRQQTQLRNRVHRILLRNRCSASLTDVFGVAGRCAGWLRSHSRQRSGPRSTQSCHCSRPSRPSSRPAIGRSPSRPWLMRGRCGS